MALPPVLFLPGTLCTRAVFSTQLRSLSEHGFECRVAGFGSEESIGEMAETAAGLLPASGKAAVAGFSMGGMVALEICRQAPGRVAKLALLNTNHYADRPERKTERDLQLEKVRLTGLEQMMRQDYLPNCLYEPNRAAEDLIIDMAIELGVDCYAAQSEALAMRLDSTATLARISCPTLVLGGEQDRLCDADTQHRMSRLIENSELLLLDDCGHFSMLEKPNEVNTALRDWYLRSSIAS